MPRKAQHSPDYQILTDFLRGLRHDAGMTQRQIGAKLRKPQSWVHNCESGNRRVDITEYVAWARACGTDPVQAFSKLVRLLNRAK